MTNLGEQLRGIERDQSHPNIRPKDAATLILVDRTGETPKVLLGRRHHGHAFMAGKFVFPGGRLEVSDRDMAVANPLVADVEARLMRRVRRPSASRARMLALAAIRETFEETGLMLGTKGSPFPATPAEAWQAFAEAQVYPDLSLLHFVARAITPPRRARRFDTRFFAADASAISHRIDGVVGPDSELVELVWVPIKQARELDLPTITRVVLDELQTRTAEGMSHALPTPFYQMRRGRFVRELL